MRPVELSILIRDRNIVDAGLTPTHQALVTEFPAFIAIGPIPLPHFIMPFLLESHSNTVVVPSPYFLEREIAILLSLLAL